MKVVGVLVACLLLGTGCTSDAPDEPKAEAAADTPSEPASPTASPTPGFVVGPPIKPSVIFKGSIGAKDKALVKRTIERSFAYFELPHPGTQEERYAEVYGTRSPYKSDHRYCGRLTEAGGIQIYLASCRASGRKWLVATIVHEVFHAMQEYTRDTYRQGPDIVVDGLYPNWFDEGSAQWVSARVLEEWGIQGYGKARSYRLSLAKDPGRSLDKLETLLGWHKGTAATERRNYVLAFFGAELALQGRGWRAALEVQQHTWNNQVPRWDSAFKETFGVSMKRFYKEFDRYQDSDFAR